MHSVSRKGLFAPGALLYLFALRRCVEYPNFPTRPRTTSHLGNCTKLLFCVVGICASWVVPPVCKGVFFVARTSVPSLTAFFFIETERPHGRNLRMSADHSIFNAFSCLDARLIWMPYTSAFCHIRISDLVQDQQSIRMLLGPCSS